MTYRDFIVGNRRGYVLRRGKTARIVVEIGGTDYSTTLADAADLATLLDLLLRDAGARPPVWMHVLAHNIATAGFGSRIFGLGKDYGAWSEDPHPDPEPWKPGTGQSADHECIDCGAPMLTDDVAQGFRTCSRCAAERRATR